MTSGTRVRESVLSDHLLMMVEGLMEQGPRRSLDPALLTQLPADAFALLSAWCDDMDISIDFRDWLDGGHSRASVALVRLRGVRPDRNAVLKYCPAREDEPQRDFKAFRKASRSGPQGFAPSHLVRLDETMSGGPIRNSGGLFLIMGYPAGTSYRHVSMSVLLGRTPLASACKEILPQILRTWNDVDRPAGQEREALSAQGFLREVLGSRCDDGKPLRRAVEAIERESPDFYLTRSGTRLSSPLAAVLFGQGVENVRLPGLRGNGHGDLHVDNILIPTPEKDAAPKAKDFKKFVLIDLSTFDDNRLLAVDPTHLMLSMVARSLQNITGQQDRESLADLVLAPDRAETGTIPTGVARAIQEIDRAGMSFANERSQYPEWQMETLAATAACALLFVGRNGTGDDGRRWFLRLAARAIGLLQNEASDPAAKSAEAPVPAAGGTQQRTATVTPIRKAADQQGRSTTPTVVSVGLPADHDRIGACTRLAEELVGEIRDFAARDIRSASETATSTTYARVIAEDLANALDGARRWYEVQRPDLHLAYATAIGIADVQLTRLRRTLDDAERRPLDRTERDGLLRVAEALADCTSDIARVGGPGNPPHP